MAAGLLLSACRYGWCLAPFIGGSPPLALDASTLNPNPWPDSGHSTVEDVTDGRAPRIASPVLDSEADLSAFRCLALGISGNDIIDKEHIYGTYWPARCTEGLPPGSIIFDGGRAIGCRTNGGTACWWADGGFTVEPDKSGR